MKSRQRCTTCYCDTRARVIFSAPARLLFAAAQFISSTTINRENETQRFSADTSDLKFERYMCAEHGATSFRSSHRPKTTAVFVVLVTLTYVSEINKFNRGASSINDFFFFIYESRFGIGIPVCRGPVDFFFASQALLEERVREPLVQRIRTHTSKIYTMACTSRNNNIPVIHCYVITIIIRFHMCSTRGHENYGEKMNK